MSATYDATLSSDKDWVRLLAGDRDVSNPRLQDEEILGILNEEPNKYYAAARACELILTRFGNLVEKQVGDLKLKYSDEIESAYREYIKELRAKGARVLNPRPKPFKVFRVS